jgi:hypothetical protein
MANIFISYSRVDRPFVRELARRLQRIYGSDSIWFDEELHGGEIWWQRILHQVSICDPALI